MKIIGGKREFSKLPFFRLIYTIILIYIVGIIGYNELVQTTNFIFRFSKENEIII